MKASALAQLRSQKLATRPASPATGEFVDGQRRSAASRRTTATMSLYPADITRMKEIRRLLEDSGIKRVSDSEAVRVALRQVPLEAPALLDAYRTMLTDDRRRR